ncbi:MAG: acyl-CoA dehydrogenase family protein [Alphaproteobacteria bacterium]
MSALRHAGTAKQRAEWLPAIVSGELRAALAYAEPKSRYELADVALSAKAVEGGYRLSGQKISVIGAPWSDYLLVSARTSGAQHDKDGITLFAVPRSAKGISARDFVTVDGMRASDISFENVQVAKEMVVGEIGKGLALLERLVDEGIAALSAEAAGAMKALIDQTNAYAKTRQQFGQAIGKFQVIQHRLVDMYVAYEQSVSLCLMATLKLGETDRERARAASAAKSHIGRAGAFIGQSAVQIHGGMGMTDELAASHYFKRLTMIDTMFGNADHHVRRFAALGAAA